MIRDIPFPSQISFDRWYREILRIYKDERLPIPMPNDDWREIANKMAGIGTFKTNNIPIAASSKSGRKLDMFKTWEDWAKAVYIIMMRTKK